MSLSEDNNEELFFNGINGATGGYFFPPQSVDQLSEVAQQSLLAEKVDGDSPKEMTSDPHLCDLITRHRDDSEDKFDVIEGVDPNDISDTGWGIIFPAKLENKEAIREALQPLIQHRQQEAGEYFKEYTVFPGESANDFLSEQGAKVFDPADPSKVPYYLLIVGDFEDIAFDFQYQLDVQYAVGRIYFKTPQEYYQYARSVVEAETTNLTLPCEAKLFGVANTDDRATELSAKYLIKPLQEFFTSDKRFLKKNSHWDIDTYLVEEATKAKLSQLMGGDETPAFLFTASHGIGFPNEDPRQLPHQGAFVCQDWPGPDFREPMPEDFYFSADDVGDDANVFGLISFHFACFGAGTPQKDEFGHRRNDWQQIAPHSFMANLPQRLLSHPRGGALAFVGHVDRAWGYSFGGKEEQLTTFKSTLQRLTEGNRIGRAVECFNERYAAVSSELTKDLWYIKAGKKSNDYQLSYLWTTNNDARGYGIIGDPAVRLMVGDNATQLEKRPETQSVEFTPSEASQSTDTMADNTDSDRAELVELLNRLTTQIDQSEQPSSPISHQLKLLFNRLDDQVQQAKTDDDLSQLETVLSSFVNEL